MNTKLAVFVALFAVTFAFGSEVFKTQSLAVNFSGKSYDSLHQAVKALNSNALAKYRTLTKDFQSDNISVGEKGQQIAELAAYIVQRMDSSGQPRYFITDFSELGATGGKSSISMRGIKEGDELFGYHTGKHTIGTLTIPSNTDYKGLKNSSFFKEKNDGRGRVLDSFVAEIVYDAATDKNSGIDREGGLFSWDENGNLIDMVLSQKEYCTPERVANTSEFMKNDVDVNSGPACPPEQMERAENILSEIAKSQKASHYCTSFKHVKTREVKVASIANAHGNWQVYECTECGRQTGFYDKDESIESIIARNKQYQQIEGSNIQTGEEAIRQMSSALQATQGKVQQ